MRQGCEQFFIETGRDSRAKNVLRANRVQPPLCAPLIEVVTGQTPRPSCVWGYVQACTVGRGMGISG